MIPPSELECTAKRAYTIWSCELQEFKAWERLTNAQQQAWRKVVVAVKDELDDAGDECPACGYRFRIAKFVREQANAK